MQMSMYGVTDERVGTVSNQVLLTSPYLRPQPPARFCLFLDYYFFHHILCALDNTLGCIPGSPNTFLHTLDRLLASRRELDNFLSSHACVVVSVTKGGNQLGSQNRIHTLLGIVNPSFRKGFEAVLNFMRGSVDGRGKIVFNMSCSVHRRIPEPVHSFSSSGSER